MKIRKIFWEKGPYINSLTGKAGSIPVARIFTDGVGKKYHLTSLLTDTDECSMHETFELAEVKAQMEFDGFVLRCVERD